MVMKRTETQPCHTCGKPATFTPEQWADIHKQARATKPQATGFVTSECGHRWQWQARVKDDDVMVRLHPFIDSATLEKVTFFRDIFPQKRAMEAQGDPEGDGRKAFLEVLDRYTGKFASALDIGCSVGTVTRLVKDRYGVPCAGFDFSMGSIEAARETDPDGDYWVLDAEGLAVSSKYRPGAYDLIFTAGVLMHTGAELHKQVCEDILALKPKLILHQEIQGPEKVIEFRTDAEYFMRQHDYVGLYHGLGCKVTHIEQPCVMANRFRKWDQPGGVCVGHWQREAVWLTCVVVEVRSE